MVQKTFLVIIITLEVVFITSKVVRKTFFGHNYDLGGGFYDLGSDNYHLKGLPKGVFTGFYPVFSYFLQKTGVIHCICPQIQPSWSSL